MRYSGKLVVVTGVASAGQMGERLAEAFAREGARVIAVDRDAAQLEARVSELTSRGLDVVAEGCDLTSVEETERLSARVEREGRAGLIALVNTAGGFAASGPLAESDPAVWPRQRAINFDTAYLATRALLPALRAGSGSIIFFAAAAALPGGRSKGLSAYVAAKSALLGLAQVLTQEEGDAGVRVNVIAPTAIRTAANLQSMGDEARYVERDEVAALVLHLCSDAARAVRGQVIRMG